MRTPATSGFGSPNVSSGCSRSSWAWYSPGRGATAGRAPGARGGAVPPLCCGSGERVERGGDVTREVGDRRGHGAVRGGRGRRVVHRVDAALEREDGEQQPEDSRDDASRPAPTGRARERDESQ